MFCRRITRTDRKGKRATCRACGVGWGVCGAWEAYLAGRRARRRGRGRDGSAADGRRSQWTSVRLHLLAILYLTQNADTSLWRTDTRLRIIYTSLTILPSLCIPSITTREPRIEELERQGGYTRWGGVDVRVPLGVFRGLVR